MVKRNSKPRFRPLDQNYNPRCSEAANKYANTFKGGKVPRVTVKENVSRLMWRLEALRAKLGGNPIGINSGFRSVAYNECVGGASLSQHLYGTATDFRVANTKNRRTRNVGKGSQFYGISCYSAFTHTHMDLRLENAELPEANYWWWPEKDEEGRDLDEGGKPCWGETTEQKHLHRATHRGKGSNPRRRNHDPSDPRDRTLQDRRRTDVQRPSGLMR